MVHPKQGKSKRFKPNQAESRLKKFNDFRLYTFAPPYLGIFAFNFFVRL